MRACQARETAFLLVTSDLGLHRKLVFLIPAEKSSPSGALWSKAGTRGHSGVLWLCSGTPVAFAGLVIATEVHLKRERGQGTRVLSTSYANTKLLLNRSVSEGLAVCPFGHFL